MKIMTIRWERSQGDMPHIMYFIDDAPVGQDDAGFDKILDAVRTRKNTRVIIKIYDNPSLGGNALKDLLPFRTRFDDLRKALGENKLVYEFA